MGVLKEAVKLENRIYAGLKASRKAVLSGRAEAVYIAPDADTFIVEQVERLCGENNVRCIRAESMRRLGELCGIEVGAACAVRLKNQL